MTARSANNSRKARKLRALMWVFLVAMTIPTLVLISKSYDQLKWEAYYQHRQFADELSSRIDQSLNAYLLEEESRTFGDYGFLVVEGDATTNYLRRSSLSNFPITSDIPGLLGFFQINPDGDFSTPLAPNQSELAAQYGISTSELRQRLSAENELEEILSSNKLVPKREEPLQEQRQQPEQDNMAELSSRSAAAPTSQPKEGIFERLTSRSPAYDVQSSSDQETEALYEASEQAVNQVSDRENTNDQQLVSTYADKALPRGPVASQSAFDEISQSNAKVPTSRSAAVLKDSALGRLEELNLESPYEDQLVKREDEMKKQLDSAKASKRRRLEQPEQNFGKRKISIERNLVDDTVKLLSDDSNVAIDKGSKRSIRIFESEIDPFELTLLESGHVVFFRKVWREGKRYIQGFLVEQEPFYEAVFRDAFADSLLSDMSNMALVYQGNLLAAFGTGQNYRLDSASSLNGTLLFQTRMSAPFEDLETVFTIRRMPAGPGGKVIIWSAFVLAMVLSIGTYLLYRASLRNLNLVGQQQDFVSAVSHELKTPLTSIRMYGEILKSGWADDDKKQGYYRYIFDESERLTRLINNVLALAKMTRNETKVNMQLIRVAELIDMMRSKIDSQVEHAGFALDISLDDAAADCELYLDSDLFSQVIINLVDNGLKFSAKAERKAIEITASRLSNNTIQFTIRDFGPGIEKSQMKKIFELFYRSENELTRETTGTGIGLALVHQLTSLMRGKIDVVNSDPGAEFRLSFPLKR